MHILTSYQAPIHIQLTQPLHSSPCVEPSSLAALLNLCFNVHLCPCSCVHLPSLFQCPSVYMFTCLLASLSPFVSHSVSDSLALNCLVRGPWVCLSFPTLHESLI